MEPEGCAPETRAAQRRTAAISITARQTCPTARDNGMPLMPVSMQDGRCCRRRRCRFRLHCPSILLACLLLPFAVRALAPATTAVRACHDYATGAAYSEFVALPISSAPLLHATTRATAAATRTRTTSRATMLASPSSIFAGDCNRTRRRWLAPMSPSPLFQQVNPTFFPSSAAGADCYIYTTGTATDSSQRRAMRSCADPERIPNDEHTSPSSSLRDSGHAGARTIAAAARVAEACTSELASSTGGRRSPLSFIRKRLGEVRGAAGWAAGRIAMATRSASLPFLRQRRARRAAGVALVSAVAFLALRRPAVAAVVGGAAAERGRALVAMVPSAGAGGGAIPRTDMSLESVAPRLALWFTLFVTSAAFHSAEIAITTLYPWKVKEFAEEEGETSPFQASFPPMPLF